MMMPDMTTIMATTWAPVSANSLENWLDMPMARGLPTARKNRQRNWVPLAEYSALRAYPNNKAMAARRTYCSMRDAAAIVVADYRYRARHVGMGRCAKRHQ